MKYSNFIAGIFGCFVIYLAIVVGGSVLVFLNIPSILIVFVLTTCMLIASFGWSGFLSGIKVLKVSYVQTVPAWIEIRHMYIIQTMQEYLLISGLIGSLIGLVQLLSNLDDPRTIGPALAVMILTIFYGLLLIMILCQPALACLRSHFAVSTALHKDQALPQQNLDNRYNQPLHPGPPLSKTMFFVILILIGITVYLVNSPENHVIESQPPTEVYYKRQLNSFEVNIPNNKNNTANHYLQIKITLTTNNDSTYYELEKRDDKVRDRVLSILSYQSMNELLTIQGKQILRDTITKEVNSFLSSGKVNDVYFREFLIQTSPFLSKTTECF